jgi:solute carrier family 35 protein E3
MGETRSPPEESEPLEQSEDVEAQTGEVIKQVPSTGNHFLSSSAKNVPLLVCLSIGTSVALILANKIVMTHYGFNFVLTLTTCHFVATTIFLRVAAHFRVFERNSSIPRTDCLRVATAGTASIVFMNFNLQSNSVGFYQMTKLMCIPCIVFLNRWVYLRKTSLETLVTLFLILLGVGIATVSDVSANVKGTLFGICAVVTTAQFQVWQGSKQTEYSLDALQITDVMMPYQLALGVLSVLILEVPETYPGQSSVLNVTLTIPLLGWIMLTCLLAVAVNILTYALIGKTSAVTFQVVGHLKTILTLIGGYYLFTSAIATTTNRVASNFIVVALVGMIFYGDLKNKEKSGDKPMVRTVLEPIMTHETLGQKF